MRVVEVESTAELSDPHEGWVVSGVRSVHANVDGSRVFGELHSLLAVVSQQGEESRLVVYTFDSEHVKGRSFQECCEGQELISER